MFTHTLVKMKLKELKTLVDELINQNYGNREVVIDLNQPTIGTKAFSNIKSIYPGFDWEFDQIRISPNKSLIEKEKDRDKCLPKKRDLIFTKKYICKACGNFVYKDDHYCHSCGQNIDGIED